MAALVSHCGDEIARPRGWAITGDNAATCPQALGPKVTRFHLHLVSDSTGDTVHSVARACLVQFEGAEAIEHIWSMVRTKIQIERVIAGVEANPGVVLYTLVNETLRAPLVDGCRRCRYRRFRCSIRSSARSPLSRTPEPGPAGPAASCSTPNIFSASTR